MEEDHSKVNRAVVIVYPVEEQGTQQQEFDKVNRAVVIGYLAEKEPSQQVEDPTRVNRAQDLSSWKDVFEVLTKMTPLKVKLQINFGEFKKLKEQHGEVEAYKHSQLYKDAQREFYKYLNAELLVIDGYDVDYEGEGAYIFKDFLRILVQSENNRLRDFVLHKVMDINETGLNPGEVLELAKNKDIDIQRLVSVAQKGELFYEGIDTKNIKITQTNKKLQEKQTNLEKLQNQIKPKAQLELIGPTLQRIDKYQKFLRGLEDVIIDNMIDISSIKTDEVSELVKNSMSTVEINSRNQKIISLNKFSRNLKEYLTNILKSLFNVVSQDDLINKSEYVVAARIAKLTNQENANEEIQRAIQEERKVLFNTEFSNLTDLQTVITNQKQLIDRLRSALNYLTYEQSQLEQEIKNATADIEATQNLLEQQQKDLTDFFNVVFAPLQALANSIAIKNKLRDTVSATAGQGKETVKEIKEIQDKLEGYIADLNTKSKPTNSDPKDPKETLYASLIDPSDYSKIISFLSSTPPPTLDNISPEDLTSILRRSFCIPMKLMQTPRDTKNPGASDPTDQAYQSTEAAGTCDAQVKVGDDPGSGGGAMGLAEMCERFKTINKKYFIQNSKTETSFVLNLWFSVLLMRHVEYMAQCPGLLSSLNHIFGLDTYHDAAKTLDYRDDTKISQIQVDPIKNDLSRVFKELSGSSFKRALDEFDRQASRIDTLVRARSAFAERALQDLSVDLIKYFKNLGKAYSILSIPLTINLRYALLGVRNKCQVSDQDAKLVDARSRSLVNVMETIEGMTAQLSKAYGKFRTEASTSIKVPQDLDKAMGLLFSTIDKYKGMAAYRALMLPRTRYELLAAESVGDDPDPAAEPDDDPSTSQQGGVYKRKTPDDWASDWYLFAPLKLLRLGWQVAALHVAEKYFQERYVKKVYVDDADPPQFSYFLILFLAWDATLMFALMLLLVLAFFLFGRDEFGDNYEPYIFNVSFMIALLLDYFACTLLILMVGLVVAHVMRRKKYFMYKHNGLTTITAYRWFLVGTCALVTNLPFYMLLS